MVAGNARSWFFSSIYAGYFQFPEADCGTGLHHLTELQQSKAFRVVNLTLLFLDFEVQDDVLAAIEA
jgi:hypothetical protein